MIQPCKQLRSGLYTEKKFFGKLFKIYICLSGKLKPGCERNFGSYIYNS